MAIGGTNTINFGMKPYTVSTYSSPSGEVQGGLQSLVANYNQAYGQAKAANEARYQQMLRIADQTTNQRAADITSDSASASASAMQNLARLGMANTTVAPTLKMGFDREKNESLNRNADQMQQTKLGIIERRADDYPDLSSLQSIIAGIGSQYGGGSGIATMLQALAGIRS